MTADDLVARAKVLKPNKWWNRESGKSYKVVHYFGEQYIWEGIYTNDAYKKTEKATSRPNWWSKPPLTTPWEFWHAYYLKKEELVEKGPVVTKEVESLWYSGLHLDEEK